MAVLSKQSYKWIIVLTFLAIIIVPGMMPSPTLRNTTLGIVGGLCLIFQFLNLKVVNPERSRKADIIQSWVLILFTIILLIVNFMV
jgi:hypothetical protein